MPLGAPGMLSDEAYTDIVAFMLHASGAATGTAALTPATAVSINTIATGAVPPDVANGIKLAQAPSTIGNISAAAPAPGGNRRVIYGPDGKPLPGLLDGALGTFRPNNNLGVIKQGNIKNYTPVTDAVLANPSPSDWLMYRGNYAGWSYSRLGQINTGNVGQLQLKWTLAMTEGGANETTPIVHDGVLFLLSAGNTVQAINAATGEVLWQNNIGPLPRSSDPGGDEATRSIAVYNDKVIVPTMQGKLYGLDARTGKIAWQS